MSSLPILTLTPRSNIHHPNILHTNLTRSPRPTHKYDIERAYALELRTSLIPFPSFYAVVPVGDDHARLLCAEGGKSW